LEGCKVRKADGLLFEPFTFLVQLVCDTEATPYYFQAKSFQEQMEWIDAIEAKANQKTKEVGLHLPDEVIQEFHIATEKLNNTQDSAELFKHIHTISAEQRKAEEKAAEKKWLAEQEKARQDEADRERREKEAVLYKENWKSLSSAEREHSKTRMTNDAIKRERLDELRKQFSSQI